MRAIRTASYEGIVIKPTSKCNYFFVGQSQSSAYAAEPGSNTSGISSLEVAIVQLAEGGYVVDKRHLPWEVAVECISGPMENVHLQPLTMCEVYGHTRTFTSFGEFFTYIEDRAAKGLGGLSMSYISMDLYAEWWRRKGARVGRKVRCEIVWKSAYSGPLFEATI